MTGEEAIKQCEDFIEHHSDWSIEAEWAKGVEFVLEDYKRLIDQEPIFDKIRSEIDKQAKWLLQAGITAYNVDIALDAIKSVIAESEDRE